MMNTHRTVLAIFATALVIAVIAAFLTTLDKVDTRSASIEAPPGAIGLARTPSAFATGSYQPELIDNCSKLAVQI